MLCVDVFRESLEWGLVQSRRSGSWEFMLGLCAHHGWLYLCFGMALSLTLSLSLLVTQNPEDHNLLAIHYEKKGCFVTNFAIQFLSCRGHLQLSIFICCEC